jgi:hypothetical protein
MVIGGGSPLWIGEGGSGCGDVVYILHILHILHLIIYLINYNIYIGIIGKEHYKPKK